MLYVSEIRIKLNYQKLLKYLLSSLRIESKRCYFFRKISEAVARGCSTKNVLLEIPQNSQENTGVFL